MFALIINVYYFCVSIIRNMKLTDKAKEAIKASSETKKELIYHLAGTSSTLYRWLYLNAENSTLTTVSAIEIIKEHTGLAQKEILTK